MRLSAILAHIPNLIAQSGEGDLEVTGGIFEDSRAVAPGGIFVARVGRSSDGHDYIPAAVQAGAAAVIGERPAAEVDCAVPYVQVADGGLAMAYVAAALHGFPSHRLTMIGVTGTDGKTTTSTLIYNILKAAEIKAGMISTVSAVFGDQQLDTGLHVTTPTAPEVQGYLARMVEARLTHCVLEATSHGLAQRRVAACDFDVAVVTNIQHEHLDFHGSWENYRDAKALLFRGLMEGHRKSGVQKIAVVNIDDTASADYLLAIPAERIVRYGIVPRDGLDVCASDVTYGPQATEITARLHGTPVSIHSHFVGEYNVSNVLAAVSAAHGLGIDPAAIKAGVEATQGVPGRMERIDEGQDFLAVVDFAHTPNALRVTLKTARMMIPSTGRVIVVFGSAGLRDPEKRAMMGRIAGEMADLTFITAEDPRTESLEAILAASAAACAEAGGVEGETFWRVPDRGEAIWRAVQIARKDDIVLACGKGHEQSMAFGATEYPWDDREAMRAALRGAPLRTLPTAGEAK